MNKIELQNSPKMANSRPTSKWSGLSITKILVDAFEANTTENSTIFEIYNYFESNYPVFRENLNYRTTLRSCLGGTKFEMVEKRPQNSVYTLRKKNPDYQKIPAFTFTEMASQVLGNKVMSGAEIFEMLNEEYPLNFKTEDKKYNKNSLFASLRQSRRFIRMEEFDENGEKTVKYKLNLEYSDQGQYKSWVILS